jgi:hypothetical protein
MRERSPEDDIVSPQRDDVRNSLPNSKNTKQSFGYQQALKRVVLDKPDKFHNTTKVPESTFLPAKIA